VVRCHERTGFSAEAPASLDRAVGTGRSLNVTVTGSLVAYKVAGLV
jgi:hypothetical protein